MSEPLSEWSELRGFQWAVERPAKDRDRLSRNFVVHGGTFFLKLYKTDNSYVMNIIYKEGEYYYFSVSVHVEDRDGKALPLSTFASNAYKDNCIWCYPVERVVKAFNEVGDDFCTDGLLIFLITFRSYKNYILKVDPITDILSDKCIQTEETAEKSEKSNPTSLKSNDCLESLSEDFKKLLLNDKKEPDVLLECGAHTVGARKDILCIRSEKLSEMVRRDGDRIIISGLNSECLDQFVQYLYTGMLPDLTLERAKQLYCAGFRYGVPSLMTRCSRFMEENWKFSNVCQVLIWAIECKDDYLKESAISYILQNKIPMIDEVWKPICEDHREVAIEVYSRFVKLFVK